MMKLGLEPRWPCFGVHADLHTLLQRLAIFPPLWAVLTRSSLQKLRERRDTSILFLGWVSAEPLGLLI